ncbi:MAG: ABC transporter substrate-binding protein [Caldilineaceae bacterium]|nr:ABC transporter substrate-binding protein [Caldilineaceae bacterium]
MLNHLPRWIATLLVFALLTACVASPAPDAAPSTTSTTPTSDTPTEIRTITHAMGTTAVTCTPQRIVTLGQGATDGALALGVTPVGAADPWTAGGYAYLAGQLDGITSIGSETEPNLETILSLHPDLIIGSRLRHEAIYDQLAAIAPTVFVETIGKAWKENFVFYAQALCRDEKGAELIQAWNDRLADFQAKMGDQLSTEVSLVRFRADEVRIYTTGFPGSVLRDAGLARPEGQIVADWDKDPQVIVLNKEQITLMDGDILFYMTSDRGDGEGLQVEEEWTSHPLWQQLKVVQNDAVYPVNEEHWNLGGGIQAANRMLDDLYGFFLPTEAVTTTSTDATSNAAFPVTIEHKFGSTTIEGAPQRVVSLGYSEQDPILALGVVPIAVRDWFGDQPFGVWPWAQDKLGNAQPELLQMPFGELNFELLASLQPDLFVATHSGITAEEYAVLSQIAPVLAQSGEVEDFGMSWQEQTRSIGLALGRSEEAEALVTEVEAQIAAAADAAFAGETIAWITPADAPGEFWATGAHTPPFRFFATLGLGASAEIAELIGDQSSLRISSERLDLVDTSILIVRAPSEEVLAEIKANPVFQQLNVVKEGHAIYFIGSDPIYGALSFSTVLSLPYVVENLVPQFVEAVSQ